MSDSCRTGRWAAVALQAVERNLTLYLGACPPSTAPLPSEDEWIRLRQAAADVPYSQEYLGLLAHRGRLEAIKHGRVSHTTRRALKGCVESVE